MRLDSVPADSTSVSFALLALSHNSMPNLILTLHFKPGAQSTGLRLPAFREWARSGHVTVQLADGWRLWVATTGNDGAVQVWDAATGEVKYKLTGHTGPTFGVAFSPDGKWLASSSVDRTIKLWQLPGAGGQGAEPLTLLGHTGAVYRLAFSPDGTRLASTGRNGAAQVYALPIADLVAIAQSRVTRPLTDDECRKFLHAAPTTFACNSILE